MKGCVENRPDIWLTARVSFEIDLYLLVEQKENLTLHQVSLSPFFHAPLQLHCRSYLIYCMAVYSCGLEQNKQQFIT